MAKIHLIVEMLDINNSIPTFEMEAVSDNNPDDTITFSLSMFLTRHSPYFDIFYDHHVVQITTVLTVEQLAT